jgi:hypothetical protein
MSNPFKSKFTPAAHVQVEGPKYDSDKMAASLSHIAENAEKEMAELFQRAHFSKMVASYEAGYAQCLMDNGIKQK